MLSLVNVTVIREALSPHTIFHPITTPPVTLLAHPITSILLQTLYRSHQEIFPQASYALSHAVHTADLYMGGAQFEPRLEHQSL